MAFTPENGTGLPNANSYVPVAEATAYFADRGNERWADAEEAERQAALVRATSAMEVKYRGKWIGEKLVATQKLAWPRVKTTGGTDPLPDPEGGTLPVNAVPNVIKDACCEIAVIELDSRYLQQAVSADNAIKSETVDVISVTYKDSAPMTTQYPWIEDMLQGLYDGAAPGIPDMVMRVSLTDREMACMSGDYDPYSDPRYFVQG